MNKKHKYLTIAEVATVTGRNLNTIHWNIKQGYLPIHEVEGARLVRTDEIGKWQKREAKKPGRKSDKEIRDRLEKEGKI